MTEGLTMETSPPTLSKYASTPSGQAAARANCSSAELFPAGEYVHVEEEDVHLEEGRGRAKAPRQHRYPHAPLCGCITAVSKPSDRRKSAFSCEDVIPTTRPNPRIFPIWPAYETHSQS